MSYLPEGPEPPGPTAQVLPSWLSYSPAATNVATYASTRTRIIYDPEGTDPPRETLQIQTGVATSISYTIKYVPLEYTGPFPAPDLGTLFTTPGQQQATNAPASDATPTNGSNNGGASNGGGGNGQNRPTPSGASGANNGQGAGNSQQGNNGGGATGNGNGNGGNASPTASNANSPSATPLGNQSAASASNNNSPPAANPSNGSAPANALSSIASVAATATGAAQSSAAASLSAAASSASAAASSASNSSLASQASAASSSASAGASSARPSSSSSSNASSSASASASSTSGAPTSGLLPPPIPSNLAAGLSGGQIAGIVLGVFFFLLLLLLLLLCCLRRRRQRAGEGGAAGVMGQHGRRISDRFASAWTGGGGGGAGAGGAGGGGGQGAYAPLAGAAGAAGVAGAAPALAAAGAGRDSDADSDDWEADHLTGGDGGSGFFVVGGRRRGEGGSGSWRARPSSGATGGYGPGGIGRGSPPSARSSLREAPQSAMGGGRGAGGSSGGGAGKGLLGGLLAGGFLARHLGRNKQGNAVPTHDPDETGDGEDVTSYANVGRAHLEGDDMDEGRGLMGGYGGGQPEMQQAGPSHWGGWPAVGGAAAAGAGAAGLGAGYAARRRNRYSSDEDEAHDAGDAAGDLGAAGSSSGNGTSSGRAHDSYGSASQGPGSSSLHGNGAGTGGDPNAANRSRQGSFGTPSPLIGASLPPPPRPARERSGSSPNVLANLPEAGPSQQRETRLPSYGSDFGTGDIGYDPKLLGAAGGAAAAGGGLAAWAAGHRDSQGSTYSKGHYPSGAPTGSNNNSGDSLGGRHSKFISADTNLLGPGAGGGNSSGSPSPDDEDRGADNKDPAAPGHQRLPTIASVGEFGERGSVASVPRGAASTSAQQGTVNSSEGSKGRSHASYVTTEEDPSSIQPQPPNSPRGTMGQRRSTAYSEGLTDGGELQGDDGESSGQDDDGEEDPFSDRPSSSRSGLASTAATGGLLSGLAAGFKRLTMGITPSAAPSSRDGYDQEEQQRDASGSSHLAEPQQSGTNVKSQQASVYTGDSGSHSRHGQQSSGSGSGGNASSGAAVGVPAAAAAGAAAAGIERPMTRASARSGADSVFDSETHGAGYAASASDNSSSGASRQRSGRSVASSLSTGVDSTSWRAQGSSGSSSSGSRRGRALSPFSDRSGGGERSDLAHASSGPATATATGAGGGGNVNRSSTLSSRGGVSSISGRAAYAGARHGGREDGSSSFASGPGPDDEYAEGRDREVASSRATAGGESRRVPSNPFEDEGEDGAQHLPPPYAVEGTGGSGARRLSSVREGPEDEQGGGSSSQGHYPSASVGEAALRHSQREAGRDPRRRPAGGSVRGVPSSLIPGYGGPGSPVGAPGGSDSWRQSPRVESLGRQAAAAAAAAQQGGEGRGRQEEEEEAQGQGGGGTGWGGGLL